MLDIRLPIGGLFTLLGVLLTVWGIVEPASTYQKALGYDVNLFWGVVLLVFGVLMLFFGRRGTAKARLAMQNPEGRAIEAEELKRGLEDENPLGRADDA
ncbi:MAG TPA: DUF6131 family protein [Longimicrobiaceae bacterium]|nr:DUF6131 family protein [Longimicrobiaceae bacterium]